jgi:microsomal dipeptidase-like Zn-dependent dipeptidase
MRMSKLDDILNNMGATVYCLGQDYTKGDGSPFKVDDFADAARIAIKDLMLELIRGEYHYEDTADELLAKVVKKVEEL